MLTPYVILEPRLQLLQIPKRLLRRRHRIGLPAHEGQIISNVIRVSVVISDLKVVGQRPGFRIEDRPLLFLVVVGRVSIHLKENRQCDQSILLQIHQVIGARLSQNDLFISKIGVLEKLSQTLVQPQGHPFGAQLQMRVLVIHRRIGMLSLHVRARQDIVLVRRSQEQPGNRQLSFGQIRFRLQRLHAFLVLYRDHHDRSDRIDIGLREKCLKHPAHSLELIGESSPLALARIRHYAEMRTPHLHPRGPVVAGPGGCGNQQKQQRNPSRHDERPNRTTAAEHEEYRFRD